MFTIFPRIKTSIFNTIILIFTFSISFAQDNRDTIIIGLGWSHQFQFAGYYAAVEKGYYKEVGLDIILTESSGSKAIIDDVLFGNVDFGVATGTILLSSENVDKITVLTAILQQSPVLLLTLESSGIKKLSDLIGKKITAGDEIKAMLISAGISLDSVNITSESKDMELLLNGTHDAIVRYITDGPYIDDVKQVKYITFKPLEYGLSFYGECLYTSIEKSKKNPELLDKVLSATLEGWRYALENKEEIIDLLITKYRVKYNKEQLLEEANIIQETLVIPSLYEIGNMEKSKWAQMVNVLNTLGMMKKDFPMNDFIYSRQSTDSLFIRRLLIAMTLLASAVTVSVVVLYLFNVRLKRAVAQQTKSLNTALQNEKELIDKLEEKVKVRTKIIEEQKKELLKINTDLENRVRERTDILHKTNQELDKFVYSISHDIRAPLASVQGLIEVIRIDPKNREKYIDLIEDSIVQLDAFIRDILEYSRNARKEVEYTLIDIDSLIDSVISAVRYIKGADRIKLIKDINLKTPIVSDKMRLVVLLRNFISNSIKYQNRKIENPFVKITARADQSNIHIKFEDNGMGIQEDRISRIYEMFYRANEHSKGSGLGLYIVKETLNAMKGTVVVASKLKKGTTFEVVLPNNLLPVENVS